MSVTVNTTASSGLSAEMKEYYEKRLLERAKKQLVFTQFGQKKPIPKGNSKTISFRKFGDLPAATTPLTEGVTPDASTYSVSEIKATVSQYGDWIAVTDVLTLTAVDDQLAGISDMQGDQAAETVDTIIRDIICSGTSVIRAGGRAARNAITSTDKLTTLEVRKAVRQFKNSNMKPFSDGYYVCIVDPDTEFDLQNDEKWEKVALYQDKEKIYKGEIGKLYGVRFVTTTNGKVFEDAGASSIDVHSSIMLAANAYGIVDIAGKSSPEFIHKPLGSGDDPLNQRETAGWKALFTAIRLNELAIIRIEHACTV